MKNYIFLILLIFILASCGKKAAKEKLEIENARQENSIKGISNNQF